MQNIQFAVPLLATILLVSITGMAFAEQAYQSDEQSNDESSKNIEVQTQDNSTYTAKIDELVKQEFKDDIKKLLRDELDTEHYQARSDEIKAEYDQFFETVIEQIRISSETRPLTDIEIIEAKEYIFYETIKDEKYKISQNQDTSETIGVSFLKWLGVQTADAICPRTTNPTYKQMQIDIDGGYFNIFFFNGNNDLYNVVQTDNSRTCERTYTLYFYDEDHPNLDQFYDNVRSMFYGRIQDIEMFSIKNNNQIKFDNTWSSYNTFDCRVVEFGCHETTTKSYIPGQTVYVSNTWNHMMDTSDTNSRFSKVLVP